MIDQVVGYNNLNVKISVLWKEKFIANKHEIRIALLYMSWVSLRIVVASA